MTSNVLLGMTGFALLHLLLVPLALAFALAITAFWIWMLVDCARRISQGETGHVGWLIAIALTHFIGAAIYFIFGRRRV